MTSPFLPCPFTYGDSPNGGQVMPMVIAGRNPSNSIDITYPPGFLWLSDVTQGGSGNLYYNGGYSGGTPAWTVASTAAGALNTLSDGITSVSPSGGNIAIEGTTNQITVVGSDASHNLTISLPSSIVAPGSISSTSTMSVGSNLTVTGDATIGDDLTVTDDLSVGGDVTVTGTINLSSLTVAGTILLNTTGNADTTIGNPAGTGAILIDTPSGDFTLNGNGNEIHIGDDAAANIVSLGSTTGVASTTISAGTGDLTLTGATTTAIIIGDTTQTGTITLGRSTAGQNISIGSAVNASAQIIDIANGNSGANSTVRILSGTGTTGAGTLLLGNNTRVTTASLADVAPAAARTVTVGGGTITTAVTDTIDIGPDGATTNASAIKTVNINTGGVTTGQVLTNIATGAVTSGTHTTSIATGNRAAGTMAVNLLTGTGTKTLSVGNADGGTTSTFLGPHNINVNQNNNTAINSGTSTGTVTIGNAAAGAIAVDTASNISLDSATSSNFTVTGAGADLTLNSVGGSVLVESTEDAALAIRLHANGGTSETIQLHADQGTGVGSINLLSDVGGLTLRATGLASADAINLEAVAGGIDADAALQINVASSQAASTAIQLTASDAAGGITMTAGTGGVNVAGNLNLTSVATQISMNGGAATDFIGTGTLTAGTVTISNTNIAANDRIFLSRTAVNASTTLGEFTYTISAGASFTVTSVILGTPGSTQTNDLSSFAYIIFRQT